ncbi:MAG: hypothetical protein PF637_04450 [Spirochaetes bacterium]|jgi:hypothetical protein|nr:hypothetical protein [Spirochaetota bacterium]
MSAKKCNDEKLSEVYDRCLSDKSGSYLGQLTKFEMVEYERLAKALKLLHSLKTVHIAHADKFTNQTMKRCINCSKRSYFFKNGTGISTHNKYFISGAVAALFVAAVTFTFTTGGFDQGYQVAGEAIHTSEEFVIESVYEKNKDKLINIASSLGGTIVPTDDGSVQVRATISDYIAIKKELTLSAEDKIFLKNNSRLRSASTSSAKLSSKYIEEVITFTIVPKQK